MHENCAGTMTYHVAQMDLFSGETDPETFKE